MVIILVGVIGGKAYSTTQDDIQGVVGDTNTVADVNGTRGTEIATDINASISARFGALADAAGFIGIIIFALVFFLVLLLLSAGMQPFSGGDAGGL